MKQGFQYSTPLLFFLLLLFSSSKLSVFAAEQGVQNKKALKKIHGENNFLEELRGGQSFDDMMRLEECGKEDDEECLKRRMIAEAHLDYIYTQHHKP